MKHSCKPASYVYCANGLLKIFLQERAGFAWSGVLALQLGDRVEVYKGVEELVAENG